MCERYRELLMKLVDNELQEVERRDVEVHLLECPDCKAEYETYRKLAQETTQTLHQFLPRPSEEVWDHYYDGVCRRMRSAASWTIWGAVAVFLIVVANVLFLAGGTASLTVGLGVASLLVGVALMWATFACNCR